MNVLNVAKPLVIGHPLFNVTGSILERNPLNVMNVGKLSDGVHTLLNTKEFILERNLINAKKM